MNNKENGFSAIVILILIMGAIFAGRYLYSRYNAIIPPPKPAFSTGIFGKVISDSDVSSVPDTPIADSLIFTIPSSEFEDYYPISEGFIDDRLQVDPAKYVMTDTLGNYQIALEPNTYTFCFTTNQTEEHKHRMLDCVDINVKENELKKINISRQFDTQFSCVNGGTCAKVILPQLINQDWETYSNDKYNFILSYPSSWETDEIQGGLSLSPPTANEANLYDGTVYVNINYKHPIETVVSIEKFKLEYETFLVEHSDYEYETSEIKLIGNNYFWIARGGCCMEGGIHAYVLHDNTVTRIRLSNLNKEITEKEKEVFNQILYTLEFTQLKKNR